MVPPTTHSHPASTAQSPFLPADLLLLIVDTVAESEEPKNELCAGALTCRFLRARSQARLFSSPTLSNANQHAAFSRAIDGSPALSKHVERLRLHMNAIHPDLPIPPHVVAAFTNLKAATFVGHATVLGNRTPERTLSFVKLFGVLSASLSRLELVLFKFADFADLVRVVWSFPDITSLKLAACSWGDPHEQDSQLDFLPEIQHYPRRAHRLTSLTVSPSLRLQHSLTVLDSCD